jgi:hypothetical protein
MKNANFKCLVSLLTTNSLHSTNTLHLNKHSQTRALVLFPRRARARRRVARQGQGDLLLLRAHPRLPLDPPRRRRLLQRRLFDNRLLQRRVLHKRHDAPAAALALDATMHRRQRLQRRPAPRQPAPHGRPRAPLLALAVLGLATLVWSLSHRVTGPATMFSRNSGQKMSPKKQTGDTGAVIMKKTKSNQLQKNK